MLYGTFRSDIILRTSETGDTSFILGDFRLLNKNDLTGATPPIKDPEWVAKGAGVGEGVVPVLPSRICSIKSAGCSDC